MIPQVATGKAGGPVLAGLLASPDVDCVLRRALREAETRSTTVAVLATGPAARHDHDSEVREQVTRWSDKYPDVTVTVTRQPGLDPAIALTAGTTGCVLAVVAQPAGPRAGAIVSSLVRRAHCPVVVLPSGIPEGESR